MPSAPSPTASTSSAPPFLRRFLAGSAAAAALLCTVAPVAAASAPPGSTARGESTALATRLDSFIDPALLESVQQSIVGIVIIWEEPDDPYNWATQTSDPSGSTLGTRHGIPAVAVCTGWFDSPTTIVTAGHCVDPAEGRLILDMWNGLPTDPATGQPMPVPVRPESKRTVYAFQPRELPGAVLTAPTIVRVDDFRSADEGDTARLEVYGMPPAHPLPVAPTAPRLGEPVTSIGFPGLNIADTDGIDLDALLTGGKTPAEVLQYSRLQPASTSGTITARQYRHGVGVYQVSADFDQGMSGGPTLNARGQVLGINSQMTIPFLGQNFNIITDTATLRAYLTDAAAPDQGQPPADPATPTDQRSTDDQAAVAGLPGWTVPAAVIGVAASTGGLVLWRRRRAADTTQKQTATGNSAGTGDADMDAGAALPQSTKCPSVLTPRQFDVAALLVDGRSAAEIADRLRIATTTVEKHVESIRLRLGVTSRADLLARLRALL